jgi:deoxycytidylate deaminase
MYVHNQKQLITIYTDQDFAMGKAIAPIFTEAWHGLCTFHIMQNAIKHLCHHKKDLNKEDTNILTDFSACMYEDEGEPTFEEAFSVLRSKVQRQTWLNNIYKEKYKWAEYYMRNVHIHGMRSTQLSESLNSDLKIILNLIWT